MLLTLCLRAEESAPWLGAGDHRVLVEVPPVPELHRAKDEMVARFKLDLAQLFPQQADNRRIDLPSLEVIRQDQPGATFPKHAQQKSPGSRPFRFYDADLADDFPAWERYASVEALAGRTVFSNTKSHPFGHRVFTPTGSQVCGTLVWPHTQDAQKLSVYGIYFNLTPAAKSATTPPAGWIGDGGNRVVPMTRTPAPPGNNHASVVDWNADGFPDILFGSSPGYIIIAENTGTAQSPAFERRRMLSDASGKPIDVGYDASPILTDWNGDGVSDLLIGTEKGCIVYFQNVGTAQAPSFAYRDFVRVNGELLLTPNWPIAEMPAISKPGDVYPADYLAIPCVCDWDGDGDSDLLAGGFVTGRVFFFENVGKLKDNTPQLQVRGPLTVDGQPLDTAWGAAPLAADLDHDGDLDLICGAKPITPKGGDASDPNANLFYFKNIGTRTRPELKRIAFPANGPSPTGNTLMALVTDWNQDSVPDLYLIPHSSMQVFAVPNIGTRTAPQFDMKQRAIPAAWCNDALPSGTFVDWNRDGFPDMINRFQATLNSGNGFPHTFSRSVNLLAGQPPIRHPSPHGDENSYVTLHDLDRDGDHDVLYGAHSGHVWFHANEGTDEAPRFDQAGYRLSFASGVPIQVGEHPPDKKPGFNFTDLQGARVRFAAADFDRDNQTDLVIGDTYGRVRLFRCTGKDGNGRPVFAEPFMILQGGSRLSVLATDWDGDGTHDVLVVRGGDVQFFRNRAHVGTVEFEKPVRLPLPPTAGTFDSVATVDLNCDGDDDLVYQTSARLTCWVERSFLQHGYRVAMLIKASARK
jgi:hypothetical protein